MLTCQKLDGTCRKFTFGYILLDSAKKTKSNPMDIFAHNCP